MAVAVAILGHGVVSIWAIGLFACSQTWPHRMTLRHNVGLMDNTAWQHSWVSGTSFHAGIELHAHDAGGLRPSVCLA